jgi:NDP-sugar pyrophosphorylase family protein
MELYKALTDSMNRDGAQARARSGGSPDSNARVGDDSLNSTPAVVLAGGRGRRLAPYTSVLPKPLMPIGEQAILEIVVDQLEAHGVTDITFCVGYLSHLIRAVFGNRANGHVNISYVQEQGVLGTAGPLRLVHGLEQAFIVMNGDVLTTIDYRDLVRHHREAGNAVTIATQERTIKIDYGVLGVENKRTPARIVRFEEKPEVRSTVSMGVYVFEPWVLDYVPPDQHHDFPELVQSLLTHGEPVGAYPFDGPWFDIGREDDYARAVEAWTNSDFEASSAADRGIKSFTKSDWRPINRPSDRDRDERDSDRDPSWAFEARSTAGESHE